MANLIQLRRDSRTLWNARNPVLADGEPGIEQDTGRWKVGDGHLPWQDLEYVAGGEAGGGLLGLIPDVQDVYAGRAAAVTVGTFSTATPSGTFQGPLQTPVTLRGGLWSAGTSDTAANTVNDPHAVKPSPVVEFDVTAATATALALRVVAVAAATATVEVWANGAYVSAPTLALTAGQAGHLLLTPAVGTARLRLRLANCTYGGLYHAPAAHAVSPALDRRPRIAVLGDSWVEGALSVPELDLWPNQYAELMGAGAVARMGQGGSGYVATVPAWQAEAYGSATRLSRLIAYAPQLVVIQGSQNDDTASPTAIRTAAAALYAAIAAGLPEAQLIVVGPPRLNAAPSAQRLANRDAVRAAALDAPNVLGFVDQIGAGAAGAPPVAASTSYLRGQVVADSLGAYWEATVSHTSAASGDLLRLFQPLSWITGTGRAGALTGNGNGDVVLGTDGAHMTSAGHAYFARRVFTESLRLLGAR